LRWDRVRRDRYTAPTISATRSRTTTSSVHGTTKPCTVVLTLSSEVVEPEASVSSGVSDAVTATSKAGATLLTGTETFHDSPGSSSGGAAIVAAPVFSQPNGPSTVTACCAESVALPVLWMVYETVA
jgi:hypothetical protein